MEQKKTRTIAFRVTEEEYTAIEVAASAGGENANDWCRKLVFAEINRGDGFSKNERLIFGELARVRYLLSMGLGLMANDNLTVEAWEKIKLTVEQRGEQIAANLLARNRKS